VPAAAVITHALGVAQSLATAGAILALAAAAGWRAAGALLPAGEGRALRLLFGAGLGLGAASLLTLAVGLAGHASPGGGAAVAALLLATGAAGLAPLARWFRELARRPLPRGWSPAGTAAAVLTAAFLAIALLGAIAPPVYYDPLVYHLSVPKLFLLRGSVGYVPENVHSQYPSALQMLNLLALELNDDTAAGLLHFGIGLLLALAVFLFGRRFADARTGAWAAAILVSTEAVAMTFCRGMIDPGVALFAFLAFFALALREDAPGDPRGARLLVLAGILGGLAVSSKYTAVWLWVILAASVPVAARRRGTPWSRCLAELAIVLAPAAAVVAPWLVKTWAYTGNPVFPFFSGLLGGRNWSPEAAARFAAYNEDMGGHPGWAALWRLPLQLFFVQGELENSSLGPLWVLALPLVLAARRPLPRAFAFAAAAGLLYLPYWLASAWILRYLVVVAPLFALVYARAYAAAPARSLRRHLFTAVILVSMAANLHTFAADELAVFQPARVALGLEPREAYLARYLQSYQVQSWASRELPAAAKVLFVGETRAYHLERDHVANSAHDPQLIVTLLRAAGDPAGVARALRGMGVTHVLVNPAEMERLESQYGTFGWRPGEREFFERFVGTQLRPLVRANGVTLYELTGR
jgi:hypothetical protein